MKRDEAKQAVRGLCHEWRSVSGHSNTPENRLSSSQFISWLESNYPHVLKFKSTTSVQYDVDMWFDVEFRQTGNR
jgi:hypothetical protein